MDIIIIDCVAAPQNPKAAIPLIVLVPHNRIHPTFSKSLQKV